MLSVATNFDFTSELVMTAANYKSNTANEIVASTDILTKQTEIDSLYLQYLMITTMNETLKKNFALEEEIRIKDGLDLFKANETLKKQCSDLRNEEETLDKLMDIVDFIEKIVNFFNWLNFKKKILIFLIFLERMDK